MTNIEVLEDRAYQLGIEHANNAASWIADGNSDLDRLRALLVMLEDGDPAFYDFLAEPHPSDEDIVTEVTGFSYTDQELIDRLVEAYETGVQATYLDACERNLRAWLEDTP